MVQGEMFHRVPKRPSWVRQAGAIWSKRFGGVAPFGKIGKALKPLCEQRGGGDADAGWAQVKGVWERYLKQEDGRFLSPAGFAEKFLQWVGNGEVERSIEATRAWQAVLGCYTNGIEGGRYWSEKEVRERCGERSGGAFMAAGGASAFSSMREKDEPFVRRAFVKAWLVLR